VTGYPDLLLRNIATSWPVPYGLLFCLLTLAGCGGIRPSPEVRLSAEAGRLLSAISGMNAGLTSIKGIGKLSLRSGSTPGSFRFAWAAVPPDRVRIDLMDPTGRPAGTLARDGTWTYLRIHKDGRLFRRRSLDRQIGKWLAVPVETADLISLVSGHVPLREHDAVDVIGSTGKGPILVLRRHQTLVERIELSPDRKSVVRIDMFGAAGQRAYRIVYPEWRVTVDDRLPPWLEIFTGDGDSIRIQFIRYRENVPIDPAMFVLDTPRQADSGITASSRYGLRRFPFVALRPGYPVCIGHLPGPLSVEKKGDSRPSADTFRS